MSFLYGGYNIIDIMLKLGYKEKIIVCSNMAISVVGEVFNVYSYF